MEHWRTLRKGSVSIYIEYAHTHTGNLTVQDIRLCISPHLQLALDLEKNLRTRHKETNSYLDAKSLAEGDLAYLRFVEIDDSSLLERMKHYLKLHAISVEDVTLRIDLGRRWSFGVVPEESKGGGLALRVISPLQLND